MPWNVKLVLTAAWVVVGTCLYVIVPLSAPIVLPLAVVVPLLWCPRNELGQQLRGWSPSALVLALAVAYLLVNTTWSLTPVLAYRTVAIVAVAAVVVHVVARVSPLVAPEPVRAMAIGFYAGYAASALFMSIEILFDYPIHLYLYALLPGLIPRGGGVVAAAGVVESLPESFLNHRMAALAFLIWPAALIATRLVTSARARAGLVLCLTPAVVAIFASAHETSKTALVGGAIVLSAWMLAPRLTRPMLTVGWIIACAAVVPAASIAYDMKLQHAEWLAPSARHRIVIWGVTSAKVPDAPLLGHGVGSAREIRNTHPDQPTYEPGTPFKRSTSLHAHNAYLQAWFETGAVGVALLFAVGIVTLAAIARIAADVRGMLYAAFAGNALLAASSFSLWAAWFVSSHALTVVFATLAVSLAKTGRARASL